MKLSPQPGRPPHQRGHRHSEIQLIDATGENVGVVDIDDALARAGEAGLDLVEISPNTEPPVCKILDYGKYKYQAQKKAAEARKKQSTVEIKEIKMRPNIDTHDYDVKMRSMTGSSRKATRSRSPCASAAAKWPIRSWAPNCSTRSRTTPSRSPRWNPSPGSKAARW